MKKNNFFGKVFITKSPKETQKLGYNFAKALRKGDIVCLYGDLGSGKTTFVQGLAIGLGIKNRIISPTFVIVRSYKVRINDEGLIINDFYHIDLYRVENEEDVKELGIEEIINNKNSIIVIEWAEKLKSYLSQKRINIEFYYRADDTREIIFRSLNQ